MSGSGSWMIFKIPASLNHSMILERLSFISCRLFYHDLLKPYSARFDLIKNSGKCWADCIPHFIKLHYFSTELPYFCGGCYFSLCSGNVLKSFRNIQEACSGCFIRQVLICNDEKPPPSGSASNTGERKKKKRLQILENVERKYQNLIFVCFFFFSLWLVDRIVTRSFKININGLFVVSGNDTREISLLSFRYIFPATF